MNSVKNETTIHILNDLLFNRKVDCTAIRSIEILRVNSAGKAEVKVTKKAGKIMSKLIEDVGLLLDSKHVKSYKVSHSSDMVALFDITMNNEEE